MTNYIFDLYGTLVDIHTNESKASLWKNMAQIFSMMGVTYTAPELKKRYKELEREELRKRLFRVKEEFHDKCYICEQKNVKNINIEHFIKIGGILFFLMNIGVNGTFQLIIG